MNNLCAALGSPGLTGWTATAGDPCDEKWQGVVCDTTNTKIISIDLSNNVIDGNIPADLPVTLTKISYSADPFSAFAEIYPNNELSGTLDVLQDLPLLDLNVENNLFTGTIPDKLLAIPDFKSNGNQFNTTTTSVAPPASPNTTTSTGSGTPFFPSTPKQTPGNQPPGKQVPPQANGPSSTPVSNSRSKSWSGKKIVWVSIGTVLGFIVLALACLLFSPRRFRRKQFPGLIPKRHEISPYTGYRENYIDNGPFAQPTDHVDKVPKEQQQTLSPPLAPLDSLRPPPPPPLPTAPLPTSQTIHLPFEKVTVDPIIPAEAAPTPLVPHTFVRCYTIASLQQYTNSFSQDNYIGRGMLGSVYRAQLPNGKLLAVKKLDKKVISQQKEEDFIEFVTNLDKIRHVNVVELMGYCSEHGQRLLIYEYYSSGNLHDALHSNDGYKKNFSWNTRIQIALGAARALVYLHDYCEPPIIHRNFKSANVLLDENLSVRVSDCGLAPLISRGSVSQLSGQLLSTYGYGAPESDLETYTSMTDVYSLGVVMLELLTGRMSYDSTRHRGEQLLVRWAVPQLYDIDSLSRIVDPSLNGEYPVKSLSNFADIISRCVQVEPEFRPPMSEVVQDLIQMIKRESPSRSDGD
ncbi:hypothetical protein M8C21_021866 [Ambrosia artemisiifolia]|uniref:Protein kinase domain-containing protein n=1 Tax=Ambrosia artemisiifolia TaxID=4212 RepID=A0AAD5CMA4_AMBAR|nr:hypothetical protein M8C21_021866 [Ambrosia artemisiifolia]